jgi:quercetin 2,3-dioxygenase
MNKVIHRAEDRGTSEHGWLYSKHSFSFGRYINVKRMGFGLLRVLNDDIVEPGMGFGTHPHNNMEIISIVLDGALEHKDNLGTGSVIYKDDVQVMSAGLGVEHSEFNHSKTDKVNFLQLWILPNQSNVTPRYDQKSFPEDNRINRLVTAISGDRKKDALYIHQNAEIDLGILQKEKTLSRTITFPGNGFYVFVTEGKIKIDDVILNRKDAVGLSEISEIGIEALEDSKFILVEVPLK